MLEKNTESRGPRREDRGAAAGTSIAFGLERIGLIAMQGADPVLHHPGRADDRRGVRHRAHQGRRFASQLFRSERQEFRQYEEVTKRFPSSEFDVLVVVEGKTLLARDNLEKLRDLVTDLQLVDGMRGLISLFSARQPPEPGKLPAPLFPDRTAGRRRLRQVRSRRVKTNEIIRGKLLSEDGTLALIVLALDPRVVAEQRAAATTVGEIRKTMADDLAGTGLTRAALRRAGDAARDPQRGRARPADLQRHRLRRRLPDRDPVLPPRLVHDHRGRRRR